MNRYTCFVLVLALCSVNLLFARSSGVNQTSSSAVIHFTNMNPHVGQKFELRAVNISTGEEVFRTTIPSISSSFDITVDSILVGQSYMFDFFADFNKNGKYDAPPVDHAWRLFLLNAQGNDELTFTHNTKFTDIKWPSLLSVQFTGMKPHLGQLLELRVLDETKTKEVGRARIDSIPQANFTVNIPVPVPQQKYFIDFYADFNKNGLYDSPPADHAWEMEVDSVAHDTTVTFTHNIKFTDTGWKYLLTINFVNMKPHIGQKFELRVVKVSDGTEVGRVSLDSLIIPNFSISVPGIDLGETYNADFYADFNKNGHYDSPPADHAWRITFNTTTGNHIENFTHNISFTDIQWPGFATGVSEESNSIPKKYSLDQNYPNPFNPSTIISYNIPAPGKVSLKVFNTLGKEVAVLVDRELQSGNYKTEFNGTNLASGVYFYELRVNNFIQTRKMLLLK